MAPIFNMAEARSELFSTPPSKQTTIIKNEAVPRGVIYCCVPLCKSYSGKVVEGKKVTLHRIPLDEKYKPSSWIQQLRNVRNDFTAKAGTRVCSLHFVGKSGPKPWCPIPTLFPSKPAPEPCENTAVRRRLNFDSGVQYGEPENIELNALDFQHCFHDYLPKEAFKPESGDILRDTTRDTG